jgi:SanA protein
MIIKFLLRFVVLTGLALLLLVGGCYYAVKHNARNKVFTDVSDVPSCRVALVLGTNPYTSTGRSNYFFTTRIKAAADLYKSGKVRKLLVSGDNHVNDYDEPTAMRDALMARGVPKSDIILDYAGFRTLDSVVRAKKVFGQEQLIIVSQRFHNERAIYIAEHHGMTAYGFNAKDAKLTKRSLTITVVRESISRVKMFIDIVMNTEPKFLGEKIAV